MNMALDVYKGYQKSKRTEFLSCELAILPNRGCVEATAVSPLYLHAGYNSLAVTRVVLRASFVNASRKWKRVIWNKVMRSSFV